MRQHNTKAAVHSDSITPEAIIKRLESAKQKEQTVEKLRTCIRSELLPWTDHFLELNGHLHLFEILSNAFSKEKYVDRESISPKSNFERLRKLGAWTHNRPHPNHLIPLQHP